MTATLYRDINSLVGCDSGGNGVSKNNSNSSSNNNRPSISQMAASTAKHNSSSNRGGPAPAPDAVSSPFPEAVGILRLHTFAYSLLTYLLSMRKSRSSCTLSQHTPSQYTTSCMSTSFPLPLSPRALSREGEAAAARGVMGRLVDWCGSFWSTHEFKSTREGLEQVTRQFEVACLRGLFRVHRSSRWRAAPYLSIHPINTP